MIWLHLATLGPIGYLKMPGTLATLVTLLPVYYAKQYVTTSGYVWLVGLVLVLSAFIISRALAIVQRYDDPQYIVLDEFLGCFITFCFVALSWKTMLLGFLLFRLFDITKIPPVRYAEVLQGSIGVMGDDIIAGLMANAALYAINSYMLEPSLMMLGLW